MLELLQFNQEVEHALLTKQPIVALESSFMTQGMPYPDNLMIYHLAEQTIRELGVVPATIAIYQGKIQIGINETIMQTLTTADNMIRASRRDIAYLLSQKMNASTNVAATIFCAHLAGISLCVTGGIGGIRYQNEEQFNISADLIELASTPIAVICSGAKSILDLPKTLDMLETHGVPIVGYKTNEFPAFYSHSSGIKLFQHLNSPQEIATLMHYHRQLQFHNGIVIANPIPQDAAIPDNQIQPIIQQARRESDALHHKSITPFLLQRIAELTAGQSLRSNLALFKSNAQLAAQIALDYQHQTNQHKDKL